MTFFVGLLFLLCFYGINYSAFQDDYLSVPKTTSIKGLFAVLILLSHVRGYGVFTSGTDLGSTVLTILGQMIVVMYFFYSGYGISEQYRKKGDDYFRAFPKRRILKTLFHFDVAVLLFIILQSALGTYFPASEYLLSLIGWTSVGNSNWFVFDILVLYLLTWIAFRTCAYFKTSETVLCLSISCLTLCFWLLLHHYRVTQEWWMNTIAAFPLGFWYSNVKTYADKVLKKHFLIAFLPAILWISWRLLVGIDVLGIAAILFAIGVVGFTSKVSIDNKVLRWLGTNCFEIYILQRLPMILLASFGFQNNGVLFMILTMLFTFIIAEAFHRCLITVDKRLGLK